MTPCLDLDTVDPIGGHSMVHDRLVVMKNMLHVRAYKICNYFSCVFMAFSTHTFVVSFYIL